MSPSEAGIGAAIEEWDGEQVICRYDHPSRSWMFIAMHSTIRGPAGGGTRMRIYGRPADGLSDAMRLAETMTRKMAMADLPVGGGKAVIAVPEIPTGKEREALLLRYTDMVGTLCGNFLTGPDMNVLTEDLGFMRQHSEHIFGTTAGVQDGRTIADATAIGAMHGIRASLRHRYGDDSLSGRSVLVQGIGGVGGPLAERLVDADARLLLCDLDEHRVSAAARRLGAEIVAPQDALRAPCDVFAPSAVGEVIGPEDASELGAQIVAGCANNPLRTAAAADALREAGVLYAPDYIVNSGGALHAIGVEILGWSSEEVLCRLAKIEPTLEQVFRLADVAEISTQAAANRIAAERLDASPRSESAQPTGSP